MSYIEDLPKKKIQDFFADGDPEKRKRIRLRREKNGFRPLSKTNRK